VADLLELIWDHPEGLRRATLPWQPGLTPAGALISVGWADALAANLPLGSHGRRIEPEANLRDGERVEVLRALDADPKERRRERVRRRRQRV